MLNWPEKKEIPRESGVPNRIYDFNKGYNTAIDDCKKAVEESHNSGKCVVCGKEAFTNQKENGWRCQNHVLFGTVKTDKGLKEYYASCESQEFMNAPLGTPKLRPVVTVEDIEQIIQSEGHKNSGKPWIEERYAIAQAIVKRLEEGK